MDKKYGIFVICTAILFMSFVGNASAKTWYVDNDGGGADFTKIQDAIDAASPGDTVFVWNGTYYEDGGVSISKERITLQGEDANTTIIPGKWTAEKVVYVTGNYVNVSGFTVTDSSKYGCGIYIVGDNCLISDNVIDSTGCGICLHSSSNCRIENNIANSNRYGIELSSASNCNVTKNTANTNAWNGIRLYQSSNCKIENNIANSNRNDCSICLHSSSNCRIENNIANSNRYGIELSSASNCNVTNNIVDSNDYGVCLGTTSTDNNITENNITNNNEYGMYLDWSGNNEIYHNNFIDNNKQAYDHRGFNNWDKGPTIGGNHWNDHICHGNPSNGTEPYTKIDTNIDSEDKYPFEDPDGWVMPPPPRIMSNAPESPVNDVEGAIRTFNITVNQTVNVSWQINGTEVQLNESVTEAAYTNTSVAVGTWNVSVIVTNANGSDMQTWDWIVTKITQDAPEITSYAPETPVNDIEGVTRTFNVTVNQTVNVSWRINGTEVQLNDGVTEATYTNQSAAEGTWNVSAIVTNANGTDMQVWVWLVTKVTPEAPEITSYAPESPVNDVEGAIRTFNITVNQTVNVSWQINGTEVQLNESVTEAAYTNTSVAVGTWNVSVIVTNANGSDMQTWDWIVTKITQDAPEITSYAPETPVNDIEGVTRTFNVTVNQTVNVSWQINGTEVQLNEGVIEATYTNQSAAEGTWNVSAIVTNANGADIQVWVWNVTSKENQPPVANFTYLPANPVMAQSITFNASNSTDPDGNITNYEWGFGDSGNTTNTTEQNIIHTYASAGTFTVTLTVTDDDGATNATSRAITVSEGLVFDTGTGTYPSIAGTHNGTITTNVTITVSKLYTYPCAGTGGHTEHVIITNNTGVIIAEADWDGYQVDGHNITFDGSFTLVANETYRYSIRTGSYPQIIHADSKAVAGGTITCTSFVDTNGNTYTDWMPAIRLGN
ncbi:CASH domain-containing protein [Candidatus Methanophagaceae archaeon]|nr:CASH domain-containing protein [Methanophagales archaeon]